MKIYEHPAIKLIYCAVADVLTVSDENVGESNTNDTDIGWGGNW